MKKTALLSLLLILTLIITAGAQTRSAPLNESQRITHLLNRIGFGPRPGDVERVRQMGVDKYIDQQLHPERIDDNSVQARLANYPSLHMSLTDIQEKYPPPQ